MEKSRQIDIGYKNHNIKTYLKIAEFDFVNKKKLPNQQYEKTNYGITFFMRSK